MCVKPPNHPNFTPLSAQPTPPPAGTTPPHHKMLIHEEAFIQPGPIDNTQFKPDITGGKAFPLQIEGLDEFMTKLDPVENAMKKIGQIIDLKHQLSPTIGLSTIALISTKIDHARSELTQSFLEMNSKELNAMASQIGEKMAQTDGDDEFLNTLLQQTLEYMKSAPHPVQPDFNPMEPKIPFGPNFRVD